MSRNIAIIGCGIAGMGAAWHLHNNGDKVTVYESADRIGGHSNTVSGANHAAVDTGFIVFNDWTYPNLINLFKHLDVETVESDMSFAVSCNQGALEYSSSALFAQKKNIFSPSYWRMLRDVLRFYRQAPKALAADDTRTLGDYLKDGGYSDIFIKQHILPMGAAIWSMGVEETGGFPLKSFVQFFQNHGLMKLINRPVWRTVKGGSQSYVKKITATFAHIIQLNSQIERVIRGDDGITLHFKNGQKTRHDQVIFACHSDQALALLGDDVSDDETAILGNIPYSPNTAYLHRDDSLMPSRRKAWCSWNVLCDDNDQSDTPVTLTYWMNPLQPFIGDDPLFVTLNPAREPKDVLATFQYHHPCYTQSSVQAQQRLYKIEGKNNTWFCGAWCGYGFHEDGLSSGLAVAEAINGIQRPWGDVTEKSNAVRNMFKGGKQ